MKKNYANYVRIAAAAIALLAILVLALSCLTGCGFDYEVPKEQGSKADITSTIETANDLQTKQPTPSDIDFSLERYNLIRRAYWVNGQREKAAAVICQVEKPLGYIVLFTESGSVVGRFVVDGKVSSLNSFLTPDSEYYEKDLNMPNNELTYSERVVERYSNHWLADVDGSYGENDNGIFFFTPDGKYVEWTGVYLYSDIPFEVNDPVVKIGE